MQFYPDRASISGVSKNKSHGIANRIKESRIAKEAGSGRSP